MKKMVAVSLFLCLVVVSSPLYAQKGTGPEGRPAKSARDICYRKCGEEMDRCVEKGGMSRMKCAKQNDECMESCKKMLK